jgi:hypothetical protein
MCNSSRRKMHGSRSSIAPPNGDGGQWWNLSLKTVVSTVVVIVFVGIRLLLHCRHEEGDKSRCSDSHRSILRGMVMSMRAHTLTRANCAHKHKHTGVAGCHGSGVYGSSWH